MFLGKRIKRNYIFFKKAKNHILIKLKFKYIN